MSLGSRLEEMRGHIPIAEFAQSLGIHKNTYSNYVKRHNAPDSNFLTALCEKFGISPNWLLLGVGPKYLDDQFFSESSKDFQRREYLLLPLIETWVIGREGEIIHDGILEYVPIRRRWLENSVPDLSEERLRMFLLTRIRRDYMVPTVNPGDIILVDTARSCRDEPKEGEVYLVRLPDGERALKRVALVRISTGYEVILFPDNTRNHGITRFTLSTDEGIHRFILARVLWLFRELQTSRE